MNPTRFRTKHLYFPWVKSAAELKPPGKMAKFLPLAICFFMCPGTAGPVPNQLSRSAMMGMLKSSGATRYCTPAWMAPRHWQEFMTVQPRQRAPCGCTQSMVAESGTTGSVSTIFWLLK
jgi:hypothetical protein